MLNFALWLLPTGFIDFLGLMAFFGGAILVLASWFVTFIPILNRYRFPAQIIGILLFGLGAYQLGGVAVQSAWEARVKEAQEKVAAAEAQAASITEEANKRVQDALNNVRRETETIIQQVEVEKIVIDRACEVPDTAVNLYNRAVAGNKKPTNDGKAQKK
jgi:hypothetical protein